MTIVFAGIFIVGVAILHALAGLVVLAYLLMIAHPVLSILIFIGALIYNGLMFDYYRRRSAK